MPLRARLDSLAGRLSVAEDPVGMKLLHLAAPQQVGEVRKRLAERQALFEVEQRLTEDRIGDLVGGLGIVANHLKYRAEAPVVMARVDSRPLRSIVKGSAVAGQHKIRLELLDLLERNQKLTKWIVVGTSFQVDVRRYCGKEVISGNENAIGLRPQTDMGTRVTRSVQGRPRALGDHHRLALGHRMIAFGNPRHERPPVLERGDLIKLGLANAVTHKRGPHALPSRLRIAVAVELHTYI